MSVENRQGETDFYLSPLCKIVRKVISEKMDIKQEEIDPDSNLVTDLGIDSLDRYGIIYYIEEESGISIPDDDDIFKIQTVGDLVEYIKENVPR
tara:strand:+ start:832 stop:1113 length:282 start_codon:yes stop_codon:yes gene_type:complete